MNIFNFTEATTSQQQQWDESVDAFIQKLNDFFSGVGTVSTERSVHLYHGMQYDSVWLKQLKEKVGCLKAEIQIFRNGTVRIWQFHEKSETSVFNHIGNGNLPAALRNHDKHRTGASFLKEMCPAIKKVYAAY